jgi:hypothetical protein
MHVMFLAFMIRSSAGSAAWSAERRGDIGRNSFEGQCTCAGICMA